jgi:hypothetical protein
MALHERDILRRLAVHGCFRSLDPARCHHPTSKRAGAAAPGLGSDTDRRFLRAPTAGEGVVIGGSLREPAQSSLADAGLRGGGAHFFAARVSAGDHGTLALDPSFVHLDASEKSIETRLTRRAARATKSRRDPN